MGMIKVFYTGARAGVKYAPAIVAVAKEARGPATEYAKAKVESSRQKRLAVAKAVAVVDGTLLQVPHGEVVVWVVFSGDKPVAEYPDVAVPPAELVADADLGKRRPPEEFPTPLEKVTAASHSAATKVRHPRTKQVTKENVSD